MMNVIAERMFGVPYIVLDSVFILAFLALLLPDTSSSSSLTALANASGLIRGRLDAAAADTETLLAHNLADIVGTITLFIAMLVLMFVFDWRMGCACLLAAVISILSYLRYRI